MGDSDSSTPWKVILISAFLGAFFGGVATYYVSYAFEQHQNEIEQQNVAQSLYIDISELSNRFNDSLEYVNSSSTDKRKSNDSSSFVFYDPIPYYSSSGKYFVHSAEISKFDSNLSRDLEDYYQTVLDIEYMRQYNSDHYSKNFDYDNLSYDEKNKITTYNVNLMREIPYCITRAKHLENEIDDKYKFNIVLQSHNKTVYIPKNP